MPIRFDLRKYFHFAPKYFIETGTWAGEGVQKACKAGFEQIFTIEIDTAQYLLTKKDLHRQGYLRNTKMLLGDSVDLLPSIIESLDAPATFWLDAHPIDYSISDCPLYKELEIIKQSEIKNHTIMIDDVRRFGKYLPNIDKDVVQEKLLEINSDYNIVYEHGVKPEDVMVAYCA